jgi:hypothetical protein
MGSLVDELRRREVAARAEAEELRGRIARLAERLARVEERLSRLVIARETVDAVLSEAGADVPAANHHGPRYVQLSLAQVRHDRADEVGNQASARGYPQRPARGQPPALATAAVSPVRWALPGMRGFQVFNLRQVHEVL